MRSPGDARRIAQAIEALLAAHAAEVDARRLSVQMELDERWQRTATAGIVEALRLLLRLVFATVPDRCEIYLGSARSMANVARLDAGEIILRWQVAGSRATPASLQSAPRLHPRPGDADRHLDSGLARRTREAFAAAQWSFELDVLSSGEELVARAWVDSGSNDR